MTKVASRQMLANSAQFHGQTKQTKGHTEPCDIRGYLQFSTGRTALRLQLSTQSLFVTADLMS